MSKYWVPDVNLDKRDYEEMCAGVNCYGNCDQGYDCADINIGAIINLCHDKNKAVKEEFQAVMQALGKYAGIPCVSPDKSARWDVACIKAAEKTKQKDGRPTWVECSDEDKRIGNIWSQRRSEMGDRKREGVTGDTIRAQYSAFSPEDESASPPTTIESTETEHKPREPIVESLSPYADGMEVYGYFESEAARARFGCPGFVDGVRVDKNGIPVGEQSGDDIKSDDQPKPEETYERSKGFEEKIKEGLAQPGGQAELEQLISEMEEKLKQSPENHEARRMCDAIKEYLTSDNIIEKELERLENERLSINYHKCRSWHLGVETSNIINFKTVPAYCEDYVKDYLTTSQQYRADSKTVCKEAYFYAKGLALKNDTINVWIFDVDDTLLSSVPFYAQYGYGTVKREHGAYRNWVRLGESAPVLPETLTLYNNLLELGMEPIFVTERWEDLEEITRENLKAVGFTYWRRTIFKPTNSNIRDVKYKSEARELLVKSGYNIIGNIGDQWADIPEDTPGRVFKLPNPLYYVPS